MTRKSIFSSPFVKLAIYYIVIGAISFGLITTFPMVQEIFSNERLRDLSVGVPEIGIKGSGAIQGEDPLQAAIHATFSIFGALLLLMPVAWVYMLTKQEKGYDESVVHTVLILPVPVIGLVIVVQNSVALAFSLAGIVAAVRFRNALDDTKDAVYIFLAIGTALAAGAGALGIAAVTSLVFNYVVLTMWRLKIGNIYADSLMRRTPKMRLGDMLAGAGGTPGAGTGNLTIGDPSLLAALTPDDLGQIVERKARLKEHLDSAGKKENYNGLLIVHAKGTQECLDILDEVLGEFADGAKLAEVSSTPDGNSTLEYLIELPKDAQPSELIATLRARAGTHIIAAEFRSLNVGKKKGRGSKAPRKPHWTLPRD